MTHPPAQTRTLLGHTLGLTFALVLVAGATAAAPTVAQPTPSGDGTAAPMTAEEFAAYATGKTLSYAQSGEVWGSEQYLPDRKVIWAFTEDDCQYGNWFEDNGNICFVYDTDPTPQCWRFFNEPSGLRAEFVEDPDNTTLSEVRQSREPLQCPGPEVGV